MFRVIVGALKYMSPSERMKFYVFLLLRSFAAFFDLLGILAIGFLATSIALFLSNGSDSNRTVSVAGITLPAINAQTLPSVAFVILLLFLTKAFFSIITTSGQANFLAKIEARAARDIVRNTLANGLSTARSQKLEEIQFSVQQGSPRIFNSILNSVVSVAAEAFLFVLVIGAFFIVDPVSAVMTIFYFASVAVGLQLLTGRMVAKSSQENYRQVLSAHQSLNDLSAVLKEASVLVRTKYFVNKIYLSRQKAASSSAKLYVLSGMPRYVIETSLIVGVSGFILYQTLKGDLVSGASSIAIFLAGSLRLTASLMPLQSAVQTISQDSASVTKTFDFLGLKHREQPKKEYKTNHLIGVRQAARVSLEDVSFSYSNSDGFSVKSVSMDIEPGQQIALIGPSGGGKSTIVDLILGLLEPKSGVLGINGMKPEDALVLDPGLIGYVPQHPGMIAGTVAENIALGLDEKQMDLQKLNAAIDKAHLTEVLHALELGAFTDLGNRKDEMSGGQLQRIGLARALYEQPGLLVMDEATSALDGPAEREIIRALDQMRGKVTVILIAHRLNTVSNADVVHYVESGTVLASGTLSHLVQNNEKVKKLVSLMSIASDEI